jgi:hypothetical protein
MKTICGWYLHESDLNRTRGPNANTCFTAWTNFNVVRHSVTNSGLLSNGRLCFQGKVNVSHIWGSMSVACAQSFYACQLVPLFLMLSSAWLNHPV